MKTIELTDEEREALTIMLEGGIEEVNNTPLTAAQREDVIPILNTLKNIIAKLV